MKAKPLRPDKPAITRPTKLTDRTRITGALKTGASRCLEDYKRPEKNL